MKETFEHASVPVPPLSPLYSFAQDLYVCGGEQDLSNKYLQWFLRLCAQGVLF